VIQTTYDIIKAHSGEIKVQTKEDEGTIFTIIFTKIPNNDEKIDYPVCVAGLQLLQRFCTKQNP
jgi:hypothetical protein